jgi:hypothetical protein
MHTFQTKHYDGKIETTSFHKVIIEVKAKCQGQTMRTNQHFSIKLSTVMDKEERNCSARSRSKSRSTVNKNKLTINNH